MGVDGGIDIALGGDVGCGRRRGGNSSKPRCAVDSQCPCPAGAVRADLDPEILIALQPEFGAPLIGGLEQQACRVRGGGAVDLEQVAAALMVEQRAGAAQVQALRRVGRRVDAKHRQGSGLGRPGRPCELHIGLPAFNKGQPA
jgi:hypothetical protein